MTQPEDLGSYHFIICIEIDDYAVRQFNRPRNRRIAHADIGGIGLLIDLDDISLLFVSHFRSLGIAVEKGGNDQRPGSGSHIYHTQHTTAGFG
jgi:hypothetical protein